MLVTSRRVREISCCILDACKLGVRDETTRTLVRKWTFMTNSESLHEILNMRLTAEAENSSERCEAFLSAIPSSEKRNL